MGGGRRGRRNNREEQYKGKGGNRRKNKREPVQLARDANWQGYLFQEKKGTRDGPHPVHFMPWALGKKQSIGSMVPGSEWE